MSAKFRFEPWPVFDRPFAEILEERRAAPPKVPAEASMGYVYILARELLRREARPDRAEQVVQDFEEAATALVRAAMTGATRGEQAEILNEYWERFELPGSDLRKRRKPRGPTDAQLRRERDALRSQLAPILRGRKKKRRKALIQELRALAPRATRKALREAAESAPKHAAYILLGSGYALAPDTVRNRISKARKKT